jgi:hypothetical protein
MPIYDVGYRRWQGRETRFGSRWFAITNKGFEIAFRSQWVRRMMFFAWLPALYFGAGIFFFERTFESSDVLQRIAQVNEVAELSEDLVDDVIDTGPNGLDAERRRRDMTRRILRNTPLLGGILVILGGNGSDEVLDAIAGGDDAKIRRVVWSWFILKFLTAPQGFALLLLIGWVAPPMIAKDLRTKAFLLYFSRPLSKFSYIFGKLMVLVVLCSVITTLPALLLYAAGIGLSPNLSPLYSTWDLPLRIVLAGMAHSLPACLLALMLSSLTTESRYAMFGWYAIWSLGFVTWRMLYVALATAAQSQRPDFDPLAPMPLEEGGGWIYVSLYDVITLVQANAMGVTGFDLQTQLAFLQVLLVSGGCLLVIWRQLNRATLG